MTKRRTTIQVMPDGSAQFTRNTETEQFVKGVFANASMERITDIKMEAIGQYFIHWLRGPFSGKDHTLDQHTLITSRSLHTNHRVMLGTGYKLLFESYEDAALYERQIVDEMRLQGVLFIE